MVLLLGKMLGDVVNLTPSSPHLPTQKTFPRAVKSDIFRDPWTFLQPSPETQRYLVLITRHSPHPPRLREMSSLPFVPPAPPIPLLRNKQMTNVEDLLGRSVDTQCP